MSEPDKNETESAATDDESPVVSTGHLPSDATTRAALDDAWNRYRTVRDGAVPDYYPALAEVDPDLFGIAVASTSGAIYSTGDVDVPFTIMSVAKPFVLALVLEYAGASAVRARIGTNATGFPFDSGISLEIRQGHLTNSMVNVGAIATTSLVPGNDVEEKWRAIVETLSRFAGRPLAVHEAVFASASRSNHRNRALANMLYSLDRLYGDPAETVELYTRQSSLAVTATDLAIMGATLADGGVNPKTGKRVVSAGVCRRVLAVMATAGMYESSGDWLFEVGLPAKSGVGGGIVTVSPGKGGLATFAPPLDAAGNSVRGQLVARFLAHRLGLNVFTSQPDPALHAFSVTTESLPGKETA